MPMSRSRTHSSKMGAFRFVCASRGTLVSASARSVARARLARAFSAARWAYASCAACSSAVRGAATLAAKAASMVGANSVAPAAAGGGAGAAAVAAAGGDGDAAATAARCFGAAAGVAAAGVGYDAPNREACCHVGTEMLLGRKVSAFCLSVGDRGSQATRRNTAETHWRDALARSRTVL